MTQAEAEAEGARAELQFQNLRRDLAKALFRAAYAERVIEVGRLDLAWLETLSGVAEERYRAGNGSQVEVLRLQNERAKRAETLRTDEGRRDHELLTINRLLNQELDASLEKFQLPETAGAVAYTPRLVELAVRHEPRLRVMRREIETAQAGVAAARKARLPDLAGFADTRQYSGDGGFREATFGIKMSLPWFNRGRYQSDVARERARLQAAEADTADQEQAVREEVHELTVNIDAARREALLYRDQIIPRSEQTLVVARENWVNNRGTFNDVMEARRLLLDAQLAQSRAVSEQYQLMAQLVLCCGLADFEMLQTIGITE
jgi:outer membrane protein TolC